MLHITPLYENLILFLNENNERMKFSKGKGNEMKYQPRLTSSELNSEIVRIPSKLLSFRKFNTFFVISRFIFNWTESFTHERSLRKSSYRKKRKG